MPLSDEQKTYLANNRDSIESSFNKYKTLKNYMGIYFESNGKAFLTFSMQNDFQQPFMKFAKKTYNYCCVFACGSDFTVQYNSFTN